MFSLYHGKNSEGTTKTEPEHGATIQQSGFLTLPSLLRVGMQEVSKTPVVFITGHDTHEAHLAETLS
jgi:hypothetical protein